MYWHFTETSHGKSAADAVGGTIKSIMDRAVQNGKNILCAHDMIAANSSKIMMVHIKEHDLTKIQKLLENVKFASLPQTRKFHEVAIDFSEEIIKFRNYSCVPCEVNVTCEHYEDEKAFSFEEFFRKILRRTKEQPKEEVIEVLVSPSKVYPLEEGVDVLEGRQIRSQRKSKKVSKENSEVNKRKTNMRKITKREQVLKDIGNKMVGKGRNQKLK